MTPSPATTKRTLSTAEERREAVLEAAMAVFAERGYLGTPTLAVAKAAGISQAYLFRLFPTKDDLVLAVVRRSCDTIKSTFSRAAAVAKARGEEPLPAMGQAYTELLEDPRLLLTQLHAYAAAASMPAIATAVQESFRDIVEHARAEAGAGPEQVRSFIAHGMLMNVLAASGITALDAPWADILNNKDEVCDP